jgi:two-component system phosphate regulon response regulator PhoB
MDLTAFRVTRNSRNVHLGPTEFRLLKFLMQHPNRIFSGEAIIYEIWGADAIVEARTVDVHVRRLRDFITREGEPDVIRTRPHGWVRFFHGMIPHGDEQSARSATLT